MPFGMKVPQNQDSIVFSTTQYIQSLYSWHIGPNKVLVAFAPVKIEDKPAALKQFNTDVRAHFASFKSDDVLSLDQFMDEATSEDGKGFEPASPENLEETVMLRMIIQDLLKKIHEINPKYGQVSISM